MTRLSESFPTIPEDGATIVGRNKQDVVYAVIFQLEQLPGMLCGMVIGSDVDGQTFGPVENTEAGRETIRQFVQKKTAGIRLVWSAPSEEVSA